MRGSGEGHEPREGKSGDGGARGGDHGVDDSTRVKEAMRAFYASEASERAAEAWIAEGGSARVPESRSAHYFIDRKVEEALRLARLDRENRVLEIGCSFGHMTFLLAERFREVVAVDLSRESIELGRRRAQHYGIRNVRFQEADAEDLALFGPEEFGGVFAFSTLRFCPSPERALREMQRVLATGGRVVVDVPNKNCPWYGPLKHFMGIQPHIHDRLFAAAEIRRLLEEAGFSRVLSKHILFTTKRLPAAALPVFRTLDRALEATPAIRTLSGIVVAAGCKGG